MARRPTITAQVWDENSATIALTGNKNTLVRYQSEAVATMEAIAYDGAAINLDMYIIRNGSKTVYGDTGRFPNVESNKFTFSAEDSNGNIGTGVVEVDMIPYVELTCNPVNGVVGADGVKTVECYGEFYSGSFGAETNTLTARVRCIKAGGTSGSWQSMSVQTRENAYVATTTLTNLDSKAAYAFEYEVSDRLSAVTAYEVSKPATPVFHWGKTDFVFEVPVTFNAGFTNTQEDDDSQETEYGTWTPTLDFGNAVNYYSTNVGWYSKIGNVVTVGFYLKASCNDGYENSNIYIVGLPYRPAIAASGGGICSGALVPSGMTFQCFVAEASDYISTRVQDSDRNTGDILQTSASGCKYPPEGIILTLSGTITYITTD